MLIKKLKKSLKASEETLKEMVKVVNVESIETSVNESTIIELLDSNNPMVNGVELLKHPYRSQEFQSIIDKGGKIAVIKCDGRIISIVPKTLTNDIGFFIEDFDASIKDYRHNQIAGKVAAVIKGNFTTLHGKPGRPKVMTPEDFWAQFTDRELEVINGSSDIDVTEFVSYINGLKKVNPATKKVKTGVNFLFVNKYIRKKTKERFDD